MCGFVGVIGVEAAAPNLFTGLQAIQHRGQDAAGLGTVDRGRFHLHKALGMVSSAIPADRVTAMVSSLLMVENSTMCWPVVATLSWHPER